MKNILLLLSLGFLFQVQAQDRFLTRTGKIHFEASIPSFEPVAAESNTVTAIINPKNGDIAVLALVKGFRFENALMEEHFNENYAESFKYPKAVLKGNIAGFSLENLSEKPQRLQVNAELTFHGKTKILTIPLEVSMKGSTIYIHALFTLQPEDFSIEIPRIVRNKVAKEVVVMVNFDLEKE